MTRRDFELIAKAVHNVSADAEGGYDKRTVCTIARELAALLAATNPRFDEGRFLEACGFDL